ncbi:MAG: alkaline phosphatase family protein [Luteibacter sp.]|uniref:alkaline phosphatase family protein n=1 Tax=Luteibacter sp. TaxID=1886636 RepID=UPI0028093B27|nr:alkaline phosphatase family protein [Luteibacter sp.]MDQ7996499.1 alkaline phosphatase family protein [Luteibacter sp.]MDQ8050139.1 alkaline phosphatase family protein [Luteibacter sp.]
MRRLARFAALLLVILAVDAHASRRVIVFVWDGMRPDAIGEDDTPNLAALARQGTYFADNHSTYPTFTMVNASSFATGSFPGTIGFYGNRFWAPGASGFDAKGAPSDFASPVYTEDYAVLRALDDHWHHDLLEAPTLLERARKAGLKTAVVGKSGPAFLQDIHEGGVILDENVALPLAFAQRLTKAGYPLPANTVHAYDPDHFHLEPDNGTPTAPLPLVTMKDGATTDASDGAGAPATPSNAFLMKAFLDYVLPVEKPDISFVWLRNPDGTEHSYGVGSPNFHLALRAQDELLGQLQAKLKSLGMDADTDLVIVSDHAHSNVAGPADLFPLRQIADGRVGRVDAEWGFSTSGAIRLADEMTHAGFKAFDGFGCIYAPVMSGVEADGAQLHPTRFDDDGRVCGKPGPYTTPSYKLPADLPTDAFVIAPNGGSEYLYLPSHDRARVVEAVRFLQSREMFGAIFVDARYGKIPGTLPLAAVHLENTRSPDIIVSYDFNADATVQGFKGTVYTSMSNERGMHGSFSPIDVHNMLLASGPDFRRNLRSELPSGNVDVAPTIAAVLKIDLGKPDGRVLREALEGHSPEGLSVKPADIATDTATGLDVRRVDGTPMNRSTYRFVLKTRQLSDNGKTYTYFDQAKAERLP